MSALPRYVLTPAGRAALALFRRIGAERARRRVLLFGRVYRSLDDGLAACLVFGLLAAAVAAAALFALRWGFAPLLRDDMDAAAGTLRLAAVAGTVAAVSMGFESAVEALFDALKALARIILLGRDVPRKDHAQEAGGHGEEHGDKKAPEGAAAAHEVVAAGDGDALDGEAEPGNGIGGVVPDEHPAGGELAGETGGLSGDGEGIRFLRGLSKDGLVGAIWLFCIHAPIVAEAETRRKDGKNAGEQDEEGGAE